MRTIEPYHISIYLRDRVVVAAQHVPQAVTTDEAGNVILREPLPAEPIPHDLGTKLLGAVTAGLLARITELEAELHEALHPTVPPPPPLLDRLGEAYAALPVEMQVAFAPAFAIGRAMVQAGRTDLAVAYVAGLEVPAEMEGLRQGILAIFAGE